MVVVSVSVSVSVLVLVLSLLVVVVLIVLITLMPCGCGVHVEGLFLPSRMIAGFTLACRAVLTQSKSKLRRWTDGLLAYSSRLHAHHRTLYFFGTSRFFHHAFGLLSTTN